ncbi:MAG: tetratricopeptide repeat protein [Bacteroidota bacterium]|nr:tetratricopeptide repeat protein [Bacteroidota bacterium]
MKTIKYFLSSILVSSLCFCLSGAEQNKTNNQDSRTIDSLQAFLKSTKTDTSKVNILNTLSKTYLNTGNYQKAMECAQQAQNQAEKFKYKKGLAFSFTNIGNIYRKQGNYDKSLSYHLNSLGILEEIGDKKEISISYNSIGIIYLRLGEYEKAMEIYRKCLKYHEEIADKNGIADCYNNIGNIYLFQENYEKALANFFTSLKISTEISDKKGMAVSYNYIGNTYQEKGNYELSLDNQLKSLKINEEIGYKQGIANCSGNIASTYEKLKKLKESYLYLNKSLDIYQEIGDKHNIMKSYFALSELHNKMDDFKKAYEYYKFFSEIKDSLLNEHSSRQIAEMDAKYESEEKGKNIELLTKDKALQQADLNKQKFIRNGFIAGLILTLLLVIILYNRYLIKKKLFTTLSNANNELIQKNTLIEKQKEKIIDSITYAQHIQQSILIEESEIQKILPDSFIYYQPKDIVSGDFYWCSKIEDKIILAAIDCTGHGVPGAFMSMIGNTLLNQIVNEKHITMPSEILRQLNIGIYQALHQEKEETLSRDGMDIALCSIDYKNNQLEYAGAQNPMYLVSDNELTVVKADRQTIGGGGMISKKENPLKREYTNHVIPIKKDMCIYLFSDGYMDQFRGSDRKKFGIQQFKDLILANQSLSMQKQKALMVEEHENWKENAHQIDDILIIGLRL